MTRLSWEADILTYTLSEFHFNLHNRHRRPCMHPHT